ncbi:CTP synthase 2-like [Tetranychus urticae]|uniref:CTP synthase n=1 Tax=Tetranychus urticae TaxID=32264 RepID=T1JU16_TETUR|nr:CTP synthase 2-like [Tetranychus urticae]XP_015787796.1 CTP synthase 2-like [Tetranychus urticae]
MKYILVTGGVISGVGKGIISSSIGVICQSLGLACTVIKIDPYVNIDAGTFSPSEHGEVYVLDDGGEVDLDLGNYERFLGLRLTSEHNITTGKIIQKVSAGERDGAYLGQTVQFVPHITDAIQNWVTSVSCKKIFDDYQQEIDPQVCVIELGGTIGDIESMAFIEAFRQFQLKVGPQNFLCVHVSLIIEFHNEQKTKATQRSVGSLRSYGLVPDLLICRSHNVLAPATHSKVAAACTLTNEKVISVPDMALYRVPLHLVEQGILDILINKFNLDKNIKIDLSRWNKLLKASETNHLNLKIALVGKYTKSNDAYASVLKATEHAATSLGAKIKWIFIESSNLQEDQKENDIDLFNTAWDNLKEASGIIIPGGFDQRGVYGKISAIKYCRENKIPCLGICLGFQLQAVEFARNVLALNDANSIEFDPKTINPIIIDMPEHNMGRMGATMRLGLKKTTFVVKTSILKSLYNKEIIEERHRHRYEVNPDFVSRLEDAGMIFVGRSPDDKRMEISELKDHPYFVGVQFHPEFLSRPSKPSPAFVGLIDSAIKFIKN